MRKILGALLFVLYTIGMSGQQQITGTIFEELNGVKEPLPFANVFIPGTSNGTTTDFDGKYEITVYPNDTMLKVSYMGFVDVHKSFHVEQGDLVVDVVMTSGGTGFELAAVTVVSRRNLSHEVMLLLEQKQAAITVEAVGAKELSLKGVSDAAGAVTMVTGISKQEGNGSLNVRGLGDRYNMTTLNKLPIPSNNAEIKNIDLSLFSTDVLSFIRIEKNYGASLYGDFGGANVDIVSKRNTDNSYLSIGVKTTQNTSVMGLENFYITDGPVKSGFYYPQAVDVGQIVDKQSYGFDTQWNPKTQNAAVNIGVSIEGGKDWSFDDDSELSLFASVSFDNNKEYTDRIENVVSATGLYLDSLRGEEYSYSTQTNAMLNISYDRKKSKYQFNSMMLNSSDQKYTKLQGSIRDVNDEGEGLKIRGQYEQNMLLVNQILGEHAINDTWSTDWGVAYNYVQNSIPDRMQNTYLEYDSQTDIGAFDTETTGRNYRYSHFFSDNEFAANFTSEKLFGYDKEEDSYLSKLSLGYSGKYKFREFSNYQLNHEVYSQSNGQPATANVYDVDAYLNYDNYLDDLFRVVAPQSADEDGNLKYGEGYHGNVFVSSLFATYEHHFSDRFLIVAGVRGENVIQEMRTRSRQNTSGRTEVVSFSEIKVLPTISSKYVLNSKQNLRFAVSKTYTLPQLQEMPLIAFSGISDVNWGNPYLKPSDVYNFDMKWELFPKSGELLSITGFGKYIVDPINRFTLSGTQNEYVSANTGDWAYVCGLEIDAKKDLLKINDKKVFISANLSLMNSKTILDADRIREDSEGYFNAMFNEEYGELQGAAPLLGNVSLGYSQRWKDNKNSLSSVFIYNYVSDRLYAIGQSSRGSEYDKAINTLDYVLKFNFSQFGVEMKAQNLLNPNYSRVQENRTKEVADYVVREYKKGINLSFSLKYKF